MDSTVEIEGAATAHRPTFTRYALLVATGLVLSMGTMAVYAQTTPSAGCTTTQKAGDGGVTPSLQKAGDGGVTASAQKAGDGGVTPSLQKAGDGGVTASAQKAGDGGVTPSLQKAGDGGVTASLQKAGTLMPCKG